MGKKIRHQWQRNCGRIAIMPGLVMTESAKDTVTRLVLAALVIALFSVAGMKVPSDPGFLGVFADLKHTNPMWMLRKLARRCGPLSAPQSKRRPKVFQVGDRNAGSRAP
jgi:hypothetical protein